MADEIPTKDPTTPAACTCAPYMVPLDGHTHLCPVTLDDEYREQGWLDPAAADNLQGDLNEALIKVERLCFERDALRDALTAALKADAIQAAYASGWDDARNSLQATIDNGEAAEWADAVLQPLRDVYEELARDESWPSLGRWLDLVWKQAIDDRDAAWAALTALGIDPRHPGVGVARVLARLAERDAVRDVAEAIQTWRERFPQAAALVAAVGLCGNTPRSEAHGG
jgi:hypothetical protein